MASGPDIDISGLSVVPDNLILRKNIKLRPFPLVLDGSLIWNIESKGWTYKLSCRDSILNGRITVDIREKTLEYRKKLSLPLAGLRFAYLFAGARLQLDSPTHKIKPSYHFGLEMRQGVAEIVKYNTVRVNPQLFLGRIGLETCTDITFKIPKQLLFDSLGGGGRIGSNGDDETWGMNLDLKELNLVLRL
ncbi:hypothetical protein CEUSTIGMA_g11288.t1 [Chlamydomonas eustigma]|uniref:Uncharacterized protein n=1 Tax=Chlamydomonas eustigma TaxID=1157962 RepID=A0A250XLG4_9CHLO|nr:hypothetical protein CEUSTIGMA_g11288.t1 [Chlamydomonas eustigma]|eukprot:GAX83863.1 hypothetical protein CEUSTIGMA_g11288.t1 [Chlamydomonas eustigma]